jgi:hypothetical protein
MQRQSTRICFPHRWVDASTADSRRRRRYRGNSSSYPMPPANPAPSALTLADQLLAMASGPGRPR